MSFDCPVLLIAWRRPHTLRRVIEAIRQVSPTRMFVACDGPSLDRPCDAEKVADVRALIKDKIDWPCQIEILYSEINQGCRLGVSHAISWFFQHVEEGIILEDDCVPHPDFFPYCCELLERYRHDQRMWSICGSNFQLGHHRGNASYYFSIHGDSWGWATWRRVWKHYQAAAADWFEFRDSGRLNDVFVIPVEREYWREILDRLFIENSPSSWAYQWWLACWMNSGLNAWPNVSLVANIGWDGEGTHTFGYNQFACPSLQGLGPITHPHFVVPDREADAFAFFHRRSGMALVELDRYGKMYPWVLRIRRLKSIGALAYFRDIAVRVLAN